MLFRHTSPITALSAMNPISGHLFGNARQGRHKSIKLSHIVLGEKTGCDLNEESTKWNPLESKPDFVECGFRVRDGVLTLTLKLF